MQNPDATHQLVHALSSSEKRLFKMYVSTRNNSGVSSNYLDLFDAMVKLSEYDDVKLKKKLKSNSVLKNLTQNKKYLKDLILKSMHEIADKRPEDEINELLREVAFLNKKNLFKEQWKKLLKAEELSQRFEFFAAEIDIVDQKMSYLIERDFDSSIAYLEEFESKRSVLARRIDLLQSLGSCKSRVFQCLRKYRKNVSLDILKDLEKLVNSFSEEEVMSTGSFRIVGLFYTINANLYDLKGDVNSVKQFRKLLVELYLENDFFLRGNRSQFLTIFFNYITSIFDLGEFDLMNIELDKADKWDLKSANDKGELFQGSILYRILYWMNTGKLQEAMNRKNEIRHGVEIYGSKINTSSLISIYYNYALVFFISEKYEECVDWLERIEDIRMVVRKDMKEFARVLKVICHFQLGNFLLIESLVRSVKRSEKLTKAQSMILGVLLRMSKSSIKGHQTLILELELNLSALQERYFAKDILTIWIESIKDKKSLKSVYQTLL